MTDREKIIYLGGFIDGEGWIGIKKAFSPKTTRSLSPSYAAILQITNTNEKIIGWLVENFGGQFCRTRPGSSKHKVAYIWYVGNRKLQPLLAQVCPYLIIKQEQANIVLNFLTHKLIDPATYGRGNKLSRKEVAFREEHYLLLKKLNRKGPSESVTTNTPDSSLELKIESELIGNDKNGIGDNPVADRQLLFTLFNN